MTFQSGSTVFANSTIANLTWLFGDASSYASTNNAEFVNHTYATPGPYNVDLIVASAIGCSDTLRRLVVMLPKVTPTDALPYEENFETTNGSWQVLSDPTFAPATPSWAWGAPTTSVINSTVNGTKAWVTNLTGSYAPRERSYLYGPCFDMTQLARPMISFNSFLQMEDADGIVLQYSDDNKNIADPTKSWATIGSFINGQSSGVEWYNAQGLASKPGNQATGDFGWTSNRDSLWLVSRHILDAVLNKPQVVFRWALGSVKDVPTRDGFALDNVRIGNRTRTILLESFFNVANSAAAEASEANFIRTFGTAAGTQVVKMNYHTSFKGDDPFYTDNPADPSSRALYYGITSTPLSRLDGERPAGPEAPASTWVQQQYNQQTLQLAEARIAISANVDSPTGSITINVDVTPGVDLPPETRLFVAIVEDSVLSSSLGPRTSQIQSGETYFISVVKKILPTASGLRLNATLPASATPTTFGPFVYTPDASQLYSVSDDLYVVAFLQNENTKDVYQSEFTALLSDPSVVTGFEPEFYQNIAFFPNPADHELTVQLPEPAKAAVPLRMFDPMGRQVVDIRFETGEQTRVIQTSDMASGLYIIQVEPGGVAVRKKQMIKH
jgi:PKD repeat protein